MLWLMEKTFFYQSIKNDRTYDNIWEIEIGRGDDYTTGRLPNYIYLKYYYKMIATDLSKQQELDAHPKTIQQISFTRNLDRTGNTIIFLQCFIIEEAKETILNFSQETMGVLKICLALIWHKMTQYNTLNVEVSNSRLNELIYLIFLVL